MANEDTHTSSLPELTPGNVILGAEALHHDAETPAETHVPAVVDPIPVSISLEEPNLIAPLRSSLVPLGSQATPPPPHPKKFSAVNINKKFLEKNSSSSSSSAPASANSPASKTGSAVSRPQSQTPTSHSRLVTTKLTAAPQSLSAPGSGWPRPSSSTPPATAITTNGPAPTPSGSGDPSPSSSGPQHSHGASAMQTQARPMPVRSAGSRESAGGGVGKPVWGNAPRSHPQQRPDMTSQSDFPTAAEVAAAPRKTKPTLADRNMAAKEATAQELASAAANKQARMEEADTFRGVHLDPNAHHWDEMDADDDNFLDGVIEFGDGRQYKIESADAPADLSSATVAAAESSSSVPSRSGSRLERDETQQLNVPVSKEERFADDFDRSWPRSRASPSVSTRDLPGGPALSTNSSNAAPSPVSPAISMASDSASRALLFNERSNKLEPYNRAVGGAAGAGPRRGSGGNEGGFPSPTDLRSGGRDQFSSGQPQLLQNRGRGFNGAGGSAFGVERGQQQQQRRDGMPGPGPPPHAPQQTPRAQQPNPWMQRKDSDGAETRGRHTAMGPPPVPPQVALGGAGGRQRPPHLPLMSGESEGGLPVRPHRRPSTSRESRLPPPATTPTAEPPSSARRAPSQSPALSHTSAVAHSPVAPVSAVPPVDLDEARKDVMQNAAARAKARRQQEEEEREKEKERARRKAAEIEERIKAAEAEKAAKAKEAAEEVAHTQDVLDVIESAVKSVQPEMVTATKRAPAPEISTHEEPKPPLRRPSLMGPPLLSQPPLESRPGPLRRISNSAPVPPPLQTGSSWRSKVSPVSATMPVTSTPVRQQPHQPLPRPPMPTFVAPPSALEQVESLAENAEEREELQVVNFSDLGKFIGVTEEEEDPTPQPKPEKQQWETPIAVAPAVRPPRPSAADFFDDRPPRSPEVEKTGLTTWRRQSIQGFEPSIHTQTIETGKDRSRGDVPSEASNAVSIAPAKDTSLPASSTPAVIAPTSHVPSPHMNRTPRNQTFYKEATMSTLDDVMSRIKGAIDGMSSEKEHRSPEVSAASAVMRPSSMFHASPTANLSVQKERWVPPPFRIRHQFDAEPQEVIITGCEPPRSPKPAWNTFLVRLPKVSTPLEPVNRKQLLLCARPAQVRWDVLSFDPPVEGMSRKEFTVNEILFRRTAFKGKSKYRVLLPSMRMGPRVNIPMSPRVTGVGAFGRPPAPADALSTWRKQPLASVSKNIDLGESETGLSTMSRSPPPELPSDPNVASIPRADVLSSSKSEDVFGSSRSRSQPKMPAGSAVAFYRDSRVDAVEPDTKPLVNFIVNSELEDSSRQSSNNNTPSKKPSIMVSSPGASSSLTQGEPLNTASKPFTPRANGLRPSPTSSPEIGMPSLMSNTKTESKSSDDSTDRTPITPPSHHTASWARSSLNISVKDSPLRGPDPEHLKAVWSQTSNKAGLHAVNSLEGIADDLTAIPFTLQDVKSEDGGTPPPTTSIASSRMSLHDVTRAFQQVPSSSSSSLRPPISPPSTTAPVARPNPASTPAYSYSLPPPPAQMMRSNYTAYSPMMSSPSTPMMYPMAPSPVPARMGMNGMTVNGHSPLYGQPVWMAPQNPVNGSMMRPMGSPYPQAMSYPSPAGSPMYAPQQPQPMQNAAQQPNGPRRSLPLMSPVMQHQNVMYQGSPILMHTPPIPVGYMNIPPNGRSQTGNHNGHPPMQPQQQHQPQQQPQHSQHQPNGHSMQHTTGYNTVPSTSFMRPTW
ncbi:hypothetical protein B0H12DRAFT_1319136 [Mycena haematopus]|nr:hypothetical protein B0H12DRAFT_1319136 [Mycena haematopus]